ncbi:MAG TPA: dethiobiotin synthase [Polyangiaceae bacterium]
MPRLVVLGCGTGVGKTRFSVALLRALAARGASAIGLKPIESGIELGAANSPGSDASALAAAGSMHPSVRHPLYAFRAPVSPHLAARAEGIRIDVQRAAAWARRAESEVATHAGPHMVTWSVVETAGGVFSPLSQTASNFDLALALDPAIWVLVAADALGVLHDVSAALQAMRARNRAPDHIVLSAARAPDASTGTNAAELTALGIATPSAVLSRGDDQGVDSLVALLLGQT